VLRTVVCESIGLSQIFWHSHTLQECKFSFALKKSAQCSSISEISVPVEALPDQPAPVKARAMRARLRRLTALTGARWPGV
jgi:hypothetical protein